MNGLTVISYSEAKAAGMKNYFTGKPCKNGHVAYRHISGACTVCRVEAYTKWATNNPDRVRELAKSSREANFEKHKARCQEYKDKNREAVRASAIEWKKNNKERCRELAKKWKKENPGKVSASNRARQLRQLNAIPPWANLEAIKEIYKEAAKQGKVVDHIIPLNGKFVCGLHVESNLQLLTAMENAIKGNSFDDSQIDRLHIERCNNYPPAGGVVVHVEEVAG